MHLEVDWSRSQILLYEAVSKLLSLRHDSVLPGPSVLRPDVMKLGLELATLVVVERLCGILLGVELLHVQAPQISRLGC